MARVELLHHMLRGVAEDAYRVAYLKGWRYSGRPTATLDHLDATGASDAEYDGYLDRACGREIWATPTGQGERTGAACEWFLDCHDVSTATVEHPTMGDVEICARHLAWLQDDWSPTKMVPPIAAAHGRKLRATLAALR